MSCGCFAVAVALAIASPAFAQYGATATIERPIPSTNPLDPTAAGSEVKVGDRIVAQTTQQLLQEAAGTRVVGIGAKGTPFCVRIRGAACDQVTVMLDDVPLSSPDTGAFDLSLVPLEAIEGFEVYRGGTPAWLNDGSIGGVLRLRPRTYQENEVGARATFGSFGSWTANAFGATKAEKVDFFGTAGAAGAQNDYPYIDDNGTVLDPTDDVERLRQNEDFLQGFGFGNLGVETSERSRLKLVFLGLGRERGEPGPGSSPALRARNKETRLIGSASWLQSREGRHPYRLQVAANYDYGRNRFTDELGEIGNGGPVRSDDRTHTIFGRVASSVIAVPWFELTTIASARYQAFDPSDALSASQPRASDRVTAAGTVETRLFGKAGDVALELRPSVRLGWTRVAVRQSLPGSAIPPPPPSSDFLPTFRLGAAIAPLEWLAFRGSVSNGYRLPSLLQLFGNRSTVVATPGLVPEQSLAVDGAVTARGHKKIWSGYATVGAFANWIDNMIRFRRTAQSQIKYENIASGRSRGVEIELRGGITHHFIVHGDVTWTQAIDESTGNQLPGQPEWIAFVQPEAHSGTLSKIVSDIMGFFRVLYVGRSYADPANLVVLVARTELAAGAGVAMFEGRLGLSFRVDDLVDVRGQDLLGFPLPGRRYTGRLTLRHSW
ncbi:MAG: TonB-dependent receptor [Myxococcales bacterium]|nr:MAG: TonB-dependent receptor [Myxococcales bacterium]